MEYNFKMRKICKVCIVVRFINHESEIEHKFMTEARDMGIEIIPAIRI